MRRRFTLVLAPLLVTTMLGALASAQSAVDPVLPGDEGRLSTTLVGGVAPGETARLAVRWSGPTGALLDAWVDLDGDGLTGPRELVADGRPIAQGIEVVSFDVPRDAQIVPKPGVWVRVRAEGEREEGDYPGAGESAQGHNGCAWQPGFTVADVDGTVYAMTVFDDGSGSALYVGGLFGAANGLVVNNIARWNGTTWSALASASGTGTIGGVQALAVFDDGTGPALYAGGNMYRAGGVIVNYIARWDGIRWSALSGPSGTGVNNAVNALVTFDDGSGPALYAGGAFTTAGGVTVNHIARWDGSAWSALSGPSGTGVGGSSYPSVRALTVFDDGSGPTLFAGGYFTTAGGVTVNNIARWDGSAWSALSGPSGTGVGGSSYPSVRALTVFDDGSGPDLYAGGEFITAGGVTVNNIARWDGSSWSTLSGPSGTGMNTVIYALAVYNDGVASALYAGGGFWIAGGLTVNYIARWDGSGWSALDGPSGTGMNGAVHSLAVFDDGSGPDLYAGGLFTTACGVAVNNIARWDGSGWSALDGPSGTGMNDAVRSLAVFDDGSGPDLYAGGHFITAGGVTVNHIARWDGSGWSVLDGPSGTGMNEAVHSLAVFDDGSGPDLYAGGSFWIAGGLTVNYIARWDGSGWSALDGPSGTGMNGAVRSLAVFDDGSGPDLFAGGAFTTAGGVTVNYIARWDGSGWSALSGPSGTGVGGSSYPRVRALTVFDDGSGPTLFAGGYYTTAGGVTVNNIARWDGSAWSALSGPSGTGVGGSSEPRVRALTVFDDGSGPGLYAGGSFTTAGGVTVNRIARWDGSSWSALSGPSGTGVGSNVGELTVFDDGSGPNLYVGGNFSQAGGLTVNRIARWDGSSWSPLSGPSGTGTNGALYALVPFDDGSGPTLFAGGYFTTAGGLASSRIAAWRCTPDTTPPSDPTSLSSTTHTPGVWSSANVIGVEWSGAADSGGSGVDGYSMLFDTDPSTVPDETPEVPHTVDPHVYSSGALADGSSIFFHLRTCDGAGNCSWGVHLGPFWVDATPPGTVTDLSSPSHPVGEPTADPTVDLTWTAATDATSGVAGYGVELSASPSWSCDQVQNTTGTSYSSPPLADGAWYAHVCAVDAAGNWGGEASAGPFVIDVSPPTVTLVHSVASTGDGQLEDQEVTWTSITQLYVSFAEAVIDPAGDAEPNDVTNPENYLLVAAGADGLFATVSCAGGLAGDDQRAAVDRVQYDGPAITARAWLADGTQLPRGRYRLLVCGSTSILDLAGNPLDGNGDGTGGDDLRLDFAVSDTNLLANPNFDNDLAAWQVSSLAEVTYGVDDADQAPTSGSVAVSYVGDHDHLVTISQCVAVGDAQGHAVGGRARVESGLATEPLVTAVVALYDAPGCGGALLGLRSIPGLEGDTELTWRGFWGWAPVHQGQQSALVTFVLDARALLDSTADLDDLFFMEMLFGDGFDWGDTSDWSTAAP